MNTVDPKAILESDRFAENFADDDEEMDSVSGYTSESTSASQHGTPKKLSANIARRSWSSLETARLLQMRNAGHPWQKIKEAFPDRTKHAVRAQWNKSTVGMLSFEKKKSSINKATDKAGTSIERDIELLERSRGTSIDEYREDPSKELEGDCPIVSESNPGKL